MRRLNRGIEPIIAVVILVAVTLVIAIGVIGWIMGWWGTFGATESLQPYPDSYIDVANKALVLHLKNTGSASAVIYKIEVAGIGVVTGTISTTGTVTGTISVAGTEVTVGPGAEGTLVVTLPGNAVAGATYLVRIYTRAGNVIPINVQAK